MKPGRRRASGRTHGKSAHGASRKNHNKKTRHTTDDGASGRKDPSAFGNQNPGRWRLRARTRTPRGRTAALKQSERGKRNLFTGLGSGGASLGKRDSTLAHDNERAGPYFANGAPPPNEIFGRIETEATDPEPKIKSKNGVLGSKTKRPREKMNSDFPIKIQHDSYTAEVTALPPSFNWN
jgi:hypothetical protein